MRWSIKIGAPDVPRRENWGDWHFAGALRDSLERRGHHVTIDCQHEWYRPTARLDDVTLVLRGLGNYRPNPLHTNIVWVISHPERVSAPRDDGYDLVFGASAAGVSGSTSGEASPRSCSCSAQTTVASTRSIPMSAAATSCWSSPMLAADVAKIPPAVEAALESGLVPAVYGLRWDGLLPGRRVARHLCAQRRASRRCTPRLMPCSMTTGKTCDDEGMISNRLFDLTACNARVISDHLPEIADVFGEWC